MVSNGGRPSASKLTVVVTYLLEPVWRSARPPLAKSLRDAIKLKPSLLAYIQDGGFEIDNKLLREGAARHRHRPHELAVCWR